MNTALATTRMQQVEAALEQLRPWIKSDGGDVDVKSIDDNGTVTVQLKGNCVGCGAQSITVDEGIKSVLMSQLDWVTDVVATEDVGPIQTGPSIRAHLAPDNAKTEVLILALDRTLLDMTTQDPLPDVVNEWHVYANTTLAYLFRREEACVFPVLSDYLQTSSGPVAAVIHDHREVDRLQQLFENATNEYVAWDEDKLHALKSSGRSMIRKLSAHSVKERISVVDVLDRSLDSDLRNEMILDLQRYAATHKPTLGKGSRP